MIRKILYLASCISLTVSSVGCGIFSEPEYIPVRSYDLTLPASAVDGAYRVVVEPFSSEAAAKYKMLTRSGVELRKDEYNRWSQTPAVMLTRYLRMALTGVPDQSDRKVPTYELSCSVLVFEADLKTEKALLCVRYTIADQSSDNVLRSGLLRYSIPLNTAKPMPEAFADAMSTAAQKLVTDLSSILKKINAGK